MMFFAFIVFCIVLILVGVGIGSGYGFGKGWDAAHSSRTATIVRLQEELDDANRRLAAAQAKLAKISRISKEG